jgi:cell fate regulator YaaT (PSP1 superfamily)
MGCSTCTTAKDGVVAGCRTKGGCSSGGCNRMNVMDWFADMPISFNENFNIIEVSFKKGARKGFYRNPHNLDLHKGQLVVVEAAQGYDTGEVTLQGELVKLQMKKRKVTERDDTIRNVLRIATEHDVNLLLDARNKERDTLIRSRAMARTLNLDMKIGDIEFQGDNKKVTIFYTADGRVDFRELVKNYARDFKVKVEMRQIGARQEAGRVGGIGTCGRELCCSTWLGDFKSVTTQAARYQNLAINSDKLSGQCGRLKCCLNYELDSYNDSLKSFPRHADKIETEEGIAWLKKTEVLKKQMVYEYDLRKGNFYKLNLDDVKELLAMNKNGKKPKSLDDFAILETVKVDESKHEDLVGQVSLNVLEEKERRKRRGGNSRGGGQHKGGEHSRHRGKDNRKKK